MTCGTCEHLKFENEILLTQCKCLCAKGLDSRISCHFDVDASKFASSQPESTSSLERESLDGGNCASALDSVDAKSALNANHTASRTKLASHAQRANDVPINFS
jgi:hypothetical protein